jgi:hypothetical protein
MTDFNFRESTYFPFIRSSDVFTKCATVHSRRINFARLSSDCVVKMDDVNNPYVSGSQEASSVTAESDEDVFGTPMSTVSAAELTWNATLITAPFNGTLETPIAGANLPEVVAVSIVVAFLSLVTSGGNLMVLISFKMDRQLQTVSNYFLLSLAVADFAIGVVSMPLYTVYLLMKRWPLGPIVCDAWLSLDYTMSNASVSAFDLFVFIISSKSAIIIAFLLPRVFFVLSAMRLTFRFNAIRVINYA